MNFYRKTINSKSLEQILNLPPELRNTDVEITIRPAKEKSENIKRRKSMKRAFKNKKFTGVDDLKELHSDSFKVYEREDLYDR